MALNRTNTCFNIGRVNNDLLAPVQRPTGECPSNNCAGPTEREHPIDKQAGLADVTLWLRSCELGSQRVNQLVYAHFASDGSRNNRRICKRGLTELFADFISDNVDSAQVAFRERNHSALHTEVS